MKNNTLELDKFISFNGIKNELNDQYVGANVDIENINILKHNDDGESLVQFDLIRTCVIYRILTNDNKFYIGKSNNLKNRIYGHRAARGKNNPNSIKSYKILSSKNATSELEESFILRYLSRFGVDRVENKRPCPLPEGTPGRTTIVFWMPTFTPTQKAIMSYKQWLKSQQLDNKLGQGAVAETFKTTRMMLSRAKLFHELAGDDLLENLFHGNKINIGTKEEPKNTDSLIALITYFRSRKEDILSISQGSKTSSDDITDEERTMLGEELERLEMLFGTRLLKQFSSILHARMQDIK